MHYCLTLVVDIQFKLYIHTISQKNNRADEPWGWAIVFPTTHSLQAEMSQASVSVCVISKLTTQPAFHACARSASAKHLLTHTITPVTAANMRDTNWSELGLDNAQKLLQKQAAAAFR